MTDTFTFQTTFILDKAHFIECYEQSVVNKPIKELYFKSFLLTVVGACLVLFSQLNPYASWFIFSLGILEAVSTYYKKPWWVARQMLSKAAKAKVTLEMTSDYIRTFSFYNDNKMFYKDINQIVATDKGWLIGHTSGRHYISNLCLSEEAKENLQSRI